MSRCPLIHFPTGWYPPGAEPHDGAFVRRRIGGSS
jgi:hypothetical protein